MKGFRYFREITVGFFLLIWLILMGLPFYFMVISSLKNQREIMTRPAWTLPVEPTLSNYQLVLESPVFFRYFFNSVVVITISVLLILVVAAMASYVFARLPFRFSRLLFMVIVAGFVIPIHTTLVPVYLLTNAIGLYDTRWALVGPYVAFNLPISVFILTEFMRQIPHEMEEAAHIDGSNYLNTFWRIIVPLSKPGFVTLAIYNAVTLWNEFVFAFVLISKPDNRTLPLAIWEYQGEFGMNIPAIMSVLTLSALPLIVIYIFGQERVTRGMMAGALK